MKRFYPWDYYEDYGLIGDYDTKSEALKSAHEWNDETDGECQIVMYEYSELSEKYELVIDG